jgi:hypothetical protein
MALGGARNVLFVGGAFEARVGKPVALRASRGGTLSDTYTRGWIYARLFFFLSFI